MPGRAMLVITNSHAGSADAEACDAAVAVLRRHAAVEVAATSSPEELAEVLARRDGREVVVAGGDGSIHAVVQALYDADDLAGCVLALVPLGTGNDFARALGLPLDPAEAAQAVVDGRPRPTDLVVDDGGRVTVNSVHLGVSAEAGKHGARWKKRLGRIGYPIGAAQAALAPPHLRLDVQVDGRPVVSRSSQVLMVAVGNGASVGGGTELTPDADPHDGLVDVLVATPVSVPARLRYALLLMIGQHGRHTDTRILRGRAVRVTGTAFDCNSDGEIDGPVAAREWRVEPAAYSMVLPAK